MRKYLFFVLPLIAAMFFSGCSNSSSEIEYLPVKLNEGDRWSFMDSEGNIYLENEYEMCPSPVRDGFFSVKEGDTYVLYKFDKQKPTVIFDDLLDVGIPQDGLLPICHKDNKIEIVNLEGETVFTLNDFEGCSVVSCENSYKHGYLIVHVVKENGDRASTIVDKKGNVLLKPNYLDLWCLGNDIFCGKRLDDGNSIVFNSKEEKISIFGDGIPQSINSDEYIMVRKNDRVSIYDYDGKEIVRCDDDVTGILSINEKTYIYEGKNGKGVKSFEGDDILKPQFVSVSIFNNGYITKKDYNDKIEIWDFEGNPIQISAEWDDALVIPGFGIVGIDGNEYSLIDEKFNETNMKNRFVEYSDISGSSEGIDNDYFDKNKALADLEYLIDKGLDRNWLTPGTSLINFSPGESNISIGTTPYCDCFDFSLKCAPRYSISATVYFDTNIKQFVYKEKTTVKKRGRIQSRQTRKVYDHYDFNNDASITGLIVKISVPSKEVEDFINILVSDFETKYSKTMDFKYDSENEVIVIKYDYGNVVIRVEQAIECRHGYHDRNVRESADNDVIRPLYIGESDHANLYESGYDPYTIEESEDWWGID